MYPTTPITLEQFRALQPSFNGVADALVQAQLDASVSSFNIPRWGDYYLVGAAYWIAHQLYMDPANGFQTAVPTITTLVQKQVDHVRGQYDPQLIKQQNDNPFLRSYYGQQYLYYRGLVTAGTVLAI